MEIKEIKQRINIIELAHNLGIQINKSQRALCPFHNDKTPSLQFSKEKQIATCFSSNCNLGTVDIIGLTEKKLKLSKHEALKYLTGLVNGTVVKTAVRPSQRAFHKAEPNYHQDFQQMQSSFLSSSTARTYAQSRNLNRQKLQIGYNAFKNSRFSYLRGCIIFPLKDRNGKTVSLYGRSIIDNNKAKHYYTPNRKGLYPGYPKTETKKLIITESIIDTATLQQIQGITENYSLLAAYGTNGLKEEHIKAIKELPELQEIILFFDGDEAGKEASVKTSHDLSQQYPNIIISTVGTPEGEDINSLSIGHQQEIFTHLLKNRKPFSFSTEPAKQLVNTLEIKKGSEQKEKNHIKSALSASNSSQINNQKPSTLNTANPYKITYATQTATYHVKGGLPKALDSMKVTLEIGHVKTGHASIQQYRKSRTKVDLFEDKQVEKTSREAGEKLGIRADLIELDLNYLTDLLDEHREKQIQKEEEKTKPRKIEITEKEKYISFGKQENLMQNINKLIGKSGIVGEETNRLFLFTCAASHKMQKTMHVVVQGSTGSGKTHTIKKISDIMPQEKVKNFTRVSDKSFYNYGEYDLCNTPTWLNQNQKGFVNKLVYYFP